MRVFDTHAHYDSGAFNSDRLELLASMPEQGVDLILNPGCDLASSRTAVELAEAFPFVYAAVGVHPSDCGEWTEGHVAALRELAVNHPKVRAIGEIGLDYYWKDNAPREFQQKVFHAQMELAEELGLPVIVHDREAHGDTLDVLKKMQPKGVLHCFSGSKEMAREIIKLGMYIGLNGVVTFSNARKSLEVAKEIPIDRLVLETDAPYLAPVPHRGKRNDSSYIPHTAEKIANLLNMDTQELIDITTENAKRLYNM